MEVYIMQANMHEYLCLCVNVFMYIHMYVGRQTWCMYVCMCMYICRETCINLYMCVYTCMHVCIYVCKVYMYVCYITKDLAEYKTVITYNVELMFLCDFNIHINDLYDPEASELMHFLECFNLSSWIFSLHTYLTIHWTLILQISVQP